ncbi:hypothetical protein MM817_03262 [Acidibacillus sp. S0AB]|uniref:Uncharacterized protein n=1 Tax=Sulfoacidibacillus ferrooxidans TaxID=2005001 RepID=A0A9X1VBZ7_9BACL|nr:hypothetical protein [Sulfoacidibacillus ferrooxidans]
MSQAGSIRRCFIFPVSPACGSAKRVNVASQCAQWMILLASRKGIPFVMACVDASPKAHRLHVICCASKSSLFPSSFSSAIANSPQCGQCQSYCVVPLTRRQCKVGNRLTPSLAASLPINTNSRPFVFLNLFLRTSSIQATVSCQFSSTRILASGNVALISSRTHLGMVTPGARTKLTKPCFPLVFARCHRTLATPSA